jgi:catechol 2,3-dioxygenase-like lactoylglutathione lyase family enzyme
LLQGIDHIVVVVNDLTQAIQDYSELGFTVKPGGEHAHRGTHNALITFQDGSYVELIAFLREPATRDNHWWEFLQAGEGLVDYALTADDLPAELDRLKFAGMTVAGPTDGGRIRPDGIRVAWRIGRVRADDAGHLPFIIDDLTERELRVPGGDAAVHLNGVTGIERMTVAVPSRAAAKPAYQTLLGTPAGDPDQFSIGAQRIQLIDAGASDPDIARFIAQRGTGPYQVTFRRDGSALAAVPVFLDPSLTHSARLSIV